MPPAHYAVYLRTQTFAVRHIGRTALQEVRPGDRIFAYLSGSKVIAGLFEATSEPFEDTTPLIPGHTARHRVRVRPVVALAKEAWVPYEAFQEQLTVTEEYGAFRDVVKQVLHPLGRVDEKVLEFLVRARQPSELEEILAAFDALVDARAKEDEAPATVAEPAAAYDAPLPDRAEALERLLDRLEAQGYRYEPWQVAAFVAALRTKGFVILAGVTGTGKSRLPALTMDATGGTAHLIPVRPDWTDSADVLGYTDLQGRFRPGALLRAARRAMEDPQRPHAAIVDEMNLARVEHYFAEVLSKMEARRRTPGGGYATPPLLDVLVEPADRAWAEVVWPSNLLLVGTVNMDESTHAFSRKVLDRAFTLELADIDLTVWTRGGDGAPEPMMWPPRFWHPRALRLAEVEAMTEAEQARVEEAVAALVACNTHLRPAQAHLGYRARDEVALFLLHAAATPDAFRTRDGDAVDPLDLALHMKVLPRLYGGSEPLRTALLGLLGWADGPGLAPELPDTVDDLRPLLDDWRAGGRPSALPGARYPRTAARLCLMLERMLVEGFTSYWI